MIFLLSFAAPLLYAATVNIPAEADTYTQSGVNAGSAPDLDIYGTGGNDRIAYIRFNLTSLTNINITGATLTLHETKGSRNDHIINARHEVYGLTDAAGNTPQNWEESTDLDPGVEYDNTGGNDIDTSVVFVLDPEQGANISETVPGSDDVDVTIAGPDLVAFLNERLSAGGLATFIVAIDSDNRGYGFASRENTSKSGPTLTLSYTNSAPVITSSRQMENLNRGVVAISSWPGIYLGWRLLGTDPSNIGFNVYRGTTKLNSTPITDSTNYKDPEGNLSDSYSIIPVIDGEEQTATDPVTPWDSFCHAIPLHPRSGYEANDASVGDLDGDGEYELVLKRLSTDLSETATNFHLIEAYEFDGTLMWTINLGPNEQGCPLEVNPIVYDFDGDGFAEVVLRTSEGLIDGVGNVTGDTDGDGKTDYRDSWVLNSWHYMIGGPEFISVFDGRTGAEIARADYIERDPISKWGSTSYNDAQNGHRANKCLLTPAYLNGQTPSLVISRGIYHRTALEAWDFRNGTLTRRWSFDSNNWSGFSGQGNHNLTVGDVDGDGKDEIVYGQMTVDDNGNGLYSTEYGHGDAIHLGKMIPHRDGLQIYGIHESAPYGADLRDAATGEILWSHTADGDTGRGCAAHVDANYPGYQMWDVDSDGTYDCSTKTLISSNQPNWGNFLIWWTADLQREILDGAGSTSPSPIINKWDSDLGEVNRLISLYNYPSQYAAKCINGTKSNPCLSGDLIGDWREEAIYPSADHSELYIYSTTDMTTNRIYTLMHDAQYRTAIAWQCNQYNQPPHPSFYIGAGMDTPAAPNIYLAGEAEAIQLSITGNTISFASTPYAAYSIETNTNLTGETWQLFTNIVAEGTNTLVDIPMVGAALFFRGEQQ